MTADNFTEDARAEAEERYEFVSDMACFEEGAEWARTHLAALEPSDAEVMVAMTAYEGHPDRVSAWRAALSAAWSARNARRGEEDR